jgi:hypothetical protein
MLFATTLDYRKRHFSSSTTIPDLPALPAPPEGRHIGLPAIHFRQMPQRWQIKVYYNPPDPDCQTRGLSCGEG